MLRQPATSFVHRKTQPVYFPSCFRPHSYGSRPLNVLSPTKAAPALGGSSSDDGSELNITEFNVSIEKKDFTLGHWVQRYKEDELNLTPECVVPVRTGGTTQGLGTRASKSLIPRHGAKAGLGQNTQYSVCTIGPETACQLLVIVCRYQRGFVWKPVMASKLIISVLRRLYVPPVLLHEHEDGTYDVVDGKQRMTSLIIYMMGAWRGTGPP